MRRSLPRFAFAAMALLVAGNTLGSTAHAGEKPRIKVVMQSPQGFINDLEYLIVDLAKEKKQWNNNIFPSIDIFLIGVERNHALRFDVLLSNGNPGEQPGYRFQPCIPLEPGRKGLKTFKKDNLDPIGITPKTKRRDYYQLVGAVFEGWMRIVGDEKKGEVRYACIAAKGYEDDVPKGMSLPGLSHKDFLAKGYDIGIEVLNTADQTPLRLKQADDFLPFMLKAVARKPDESEVRFNFRKLSQEHKFEQLHRLYVEAKQITVGWTTNVAKKQGEAEFVLKALPETGLFGALQEMGTEPSQFAALPMADDPVLGLRLNLTFDDFRREQLDEWYPAAREAAKESIDKSEEFTETEREPGKQAVDLLFDMLIAGDPLGRLDLFVDLTRAETGKLGIVFGVLAKDGKVADEIVKLIPQFHEEWTVEMNVEEVGDTAIHKIDVSADATKAVLDYFGTTGIVYVATSPRLVWIAGGDGAYEALKAKIEKVAASEQAGEATDEGEPAVEGEDTAEGEAAEAEAVAAESGPKNGEPESGEPEKIVDLKLQAGTLMAFADDLSTETGWNLLGAINIKPPGGSDEGGGSSLQPIDPVEMRQIICRSLADIDDRITGVITRTDDHIGGKMTFAPGVLRAVGKIIAKVAEDNL